MIEDSLWRAIGARLPALAGLLLFAACGDSGPATSTTPGPLPTVLVETVREAAHATAAIRFSGRVEAVQQGAVSFQVAGTVAELLVDAGDSVSAGQLLARLDGTRTRAALAAAVGSLAAAKATLAELEAGPRSEVVAAARSAVRAAQLQLELANSTAGRLATAHESAAVSSQAEEEARRSAEIAAARFAEANARLDELLAGVRSEQIDAQRALVAARTAEHDRRERDVVDLELRAPYAARIGARRIEQGSVVTAGAPAFVLFGTERMRVRVGLPAERAGELIANIVDVRIGGRELELQRDGIATLPRVDPRAHVVDALLPLSASPTVRDGEVATVWCSPASQRGIAVPQAALRAGPRGLFRAMVAVPIDGGESTFRVENRDVLVDRWLGERVLVTGGLQDGERLIVSGADHVLRGMTVQLGQGQGGK